ncbi:hypothetical protein BO71DRAFT_398596 [Aspergillus ellipticus CBS 707.79]|uniref:Uncharacterized protein n=1 Tax=Aspergillus ellipticus CBS 707.79 TaxID=1448320 RepID=A0A319DKZ4_9EURO|nr:hypothetical protein BO71DRAFT_398596 [Aspergillus ellipticus CBS 707.79]
MLKKWEGCYSFPPPPTSSDWDGEIRGGRQRGNLLADTASGSIKLHAPALSSPRARQPLGFRGGIGAAAPRVWTGATVRIALDAPWSACI